MAFARSAKRRFANAYVYVLRKLRAARILFYPSFLWRLGNLGYLRQFVNRRPCFFLTNRYYLSRNFGVSERIHNALLHYEHESRSFDAAYRAHVYGQNGLSLWKEVADGVDFCIRLVVSEGNGCEGDLSVILDVNGNEACRMSYTVVDGASFGLAPGPTLFVTRNQLKRKQELDLFRRCYPHNSPQYFCLAAVAGIAVASGFRCLAAIRGKEQTSYHPEFDAHFKNSYCTFWQQFGARLIDCQAWLLQVPLEPPPISAVSAKHRGRANDRRARWAAITRQAMSTISAHRLKEPGLTGTRVWFHTMLCFFAQTLCDYAEII